MGRYLCMCMCMYVPVSVYVGTRAQNDLAAHGCKSSIFMSAYRQHIVNIRVSHATIPLPTHRYSVQNAHIHEHTQNEKRIRITRIHGVCMSARSL